MSGACSTCSSWNASPLRSDGAQHLCTGLGVAQLRQSFNDLRADCFVFASRIDDSMGLPALEIDLNAVSAIGIGSGLRSADADGLGQLSSELGRPPNQQAAQMLPRDTRSTRQAVQTSSNSPDPWIAARCKKALMGQPLVDVDLLAQGAQAVVGNHKNGVVRPQYCSMSPRVAPSWQ